MKRHAFKNLIAFIIAALLVTVSAMPVFAAANSSVKTVKVGFFSYPGYHEITDDARSGYGYDFLMLLQRYTNLSFEFVGYENSWEDMQKMLAAGKIDFVTSARKTPAREALFDFSEPIGTNSAQINVRSGDERFIPGDFSALNGTVIGEIAGNSRNADLDVFAAEKGFSFSAVEYSTADELEEALKSGKIDAALSSSLRKTTGEKTVAEFAPEDFYVIVKKGDTDLLKEINYGISQMDAYEGNWRDNLHYENYQNAANASITFTQREKDYIKAVQNGEKTITVSAQPDRDPYSFVESGKLTGIIPDYFAHLMEMAGLPYTELVAKDREEFEEWASENRTDVVMDCRYKSAPSVDSDFGLVTDAYMQLTVARVTKKGFSGDIGTVASVGSQGPDSIEDDIPGDAEYITVDSREEAMQAVKDGRADACYVYTYMAEKFINTDPSSNLQLTVLEHPVYSEYIYVSPYSDHELCSILNKCIKADGSGALDEYVKKYTTVTAGDIGLIQYLEMHPEIIIIASAVLIVVTAVLASSEVRAKTEKLKNEQLEKNIERLNQIKGLASQFSILYFVNLNTLETESDYLRETAPEKAKDIDKKSENFFEAFKSSMAVYAHPDYRDELLKFADPEYVRNILRGKRRYEYNFLCMNAEGSYSWTEMVLMKFSDNIDDEPVSIAVGYRDTDVETRQKLEEYARKERDLEAIKGLANEYDTLQFADLGSDSFSLYYMTEDSPEKARRQAGEDRKFSDFYRESMETFCHPDHLAEMLKYADPEYIKNILMEQRKHTRRFLCNSDRGYQWCELALIRLDDGDIPKRIAVGYTNINDIVENEKSQEKALTEALLAAEAGSRAKTEFLFNMSHDIRTPMNAITGFTDQAIRHIDDPEVLRTALGKVQDSSEYLLRIVNDILDMAKIESGKLELSEKLYHIASGHNTLVDVFTSEAAKKNIALHTSYDIRDTYLWIDRNRTDQIVSNLISNSIKYTESGGDIWYSVRQTESERPGYGRFVLEVKDTGCGMSPEFLEKVFDAFERDQSAKVNGIQGTGLGMAIVKKLSEAMGGTIDIQSEPGKGTAVQFTMYLRIATPEEIADFSEEGRAKNETANTDFRGRKALLVEDNELNREIATDLLTEQGIEVDEAENGAVAVEKLRAAGPDRYDFVLMDIQMPVMGGYEAARAIRKMYPDAGLPIIALSANAFAEDKAESIAAGMNDHVAKPIDTKELFGCLSRYIK